jgi:SAM-dependent methyltransferase
MIETERQKVSEFWSQYEPSREEPNFYQSPVTRSHIISLAFGDQYVDKLRGNTYFAEDYFLENHLRGRQIRTMASLCCGFGSVERHIASRLPELEHCLGLDIADGALEAARRRVAELGLRGLEYRKADLNAYEWPEAQYDLIVANGALHHLANLDGACRGIYKALRPGGVLLASEYVGPPYQHHGPRQLELINAAAFLVPPELRARQPIRLPFPDSLPVRKLSRMRALAAEDVNPKWSPRKKSIVAVLRRLLPPGSDAFRFAPLHLSPRKHLLRVDPSEGVRAGEIIPCLRTVFGQLRVFPFGGGLLQYAMDENFYNRFDAANPKHVACMNRLSALEKSLMASGEIETENAFIIAEKPASSAH